MAEMDRIIVIHNGELAEVGSHEQLLEQGGIYRNLYDIYRRGGQSMKRARQESFSVMRPR